MRKVSLFSGKLTLLIAISILFGNGKVMAQNKSLNNAQNNIVTIPVEKVVDKIRGGMLGQIAGNLNGLPHEMRYINEPGNVKNYVPSLQNGAITDDDTDFEWVYICEMQKNRIAFLSYDTIFNLWKERINKRIWCSNRYARFLMDIGIKPPYTGYISLNPWAEFNISGQFLCETFALIAPAMPQTAAKIGLNYTKITIDNEPAQTTQLFTTMIATAFIENDINKILDAGLMSLDSKSKIRQIVNDIRQWHKQYPTNWRETRKLLKEKYTLENGEIRDRNGSELNTGSVIAALLYGQGDYQETMKMAFNFGWDADNTAATAGTIIGVIVGYRWMLSQGWQIVDRYENTTRDNMPMDETITSFSDRLISLFEMINEKNGGTKTVLNNVEVYQIHTEQPAMITPLISAEEQKEQLKKEQKKIIISNLLNGSREEKAAAVYKSVCLDLNQEISKKYPEQWQSACFELSGYWRLMSNLMHGQYDDQFQALTNLRNKFYDAGFKAPSKKYSDDELYDNSEIWKVPEFKNAGE